MMERKKCHVHNVKKIAFYEGVYFNATKSLGIDKQTKPMFEKKYICQSL